jgi:nickel-dependent lactate racemase
MPYGEGTVTLDIPAPLAEKLHFARPEPLDALDDPAREMLAAVEAPVESPPLSERLRAARSVLVVVSDHTRSCAYPMWLPRLLDFARSHLAEGAVLKLIMACGTHAAPSAEEVRRVLGVDEKVVLHDSRDEKSLVEVGVSSRGTSYVINRLLTEADLILATGAVGYHYFAGFTGGVKALFPGLGGYDAVVHNHGLCLDLEDRYFAEGVAPGNLDGNPVHEDLREIIPHLPPVFLVNVVLAGDKAPAYFVAGDAIKAHRAAGDFVDKHFRCSAPRRADLILLSAGGHPRDISLYQAHKALKHAEAALSRRGRILFFAQCPEGMGHPQFEQWRELDFAATVSLLRQRYLPIGHIALSLRTLYKRFGLNLVSEMDVAEAEEWGFEPVAPDKASLKAAWMLARADSPVVVTHGSSILLSAGQ